MNECKFCGEELTASHWCSKQKEKQQEVECRFCRSIGDTASFILEDVFLFGGLMREIAWFCPACHATLE